MKPTVEMLLDDARGQCLECDGARRLVESHCTNEACRWFKYRKFRLERSQQMVMFTFDIFCQHCTDFLFNKKDSMLSSMFWSDIRLMLVADLNEHRIKQPPARWWSTIAQDVLPRIGWRIDGVTRTSPINRARENRYSKIK
jgi:hypothetical protein